jgi:hypothetical protein
MSPEHRHQFYGGDISDYIINNNNQKQAQVQLPFDKGQDDLSNIYEKQIKGKPNIDTTGLVSTGSILPKFDRDPHFCKIQDNLSATLNAIAQQIGLNDNDGTAVLQPATIALKNQTAADIATANNSVLKAIEELKSAGAVL